MVAVWPCIFVIDCDGTVWETEHVFMCLFPIIHLSINENLCLGSTTNVIGYIYEGHPKNTVI